MKTNVMGKNESNLSTQSMDWVNKKHIHI